MTVTYWGAGEPPASSGDDIKVGVWWKQSWGCPALHYEEQIPPVIYCDYDWYAAFPEGDDER